MQAFLVEGKWVKYKGRLEKEQSYKLPWGVVKASNSKEAVREYLISKSKILTKFPGFVLEKLLLSLEKNVGSTDKKFYNLSSPEMEKIEWQFIVFKC